MTTPAPAIERPTLLDLIEQPGASRVPRSITLPAPPAGTDWSVQVPPGVVWDLLAATATLTTSAVVANRYARLQASDGVQTVWNVAPGGATAASSAILHSWVRDLGYSSTGGVFGGYNQAAPSVPLLGGWTLLASTAARDAGDAWSPVSLYVVERRPPASAAAAVLLPEGV